MDKNDNNDNNDTNYPFRSYSGNPPPYNPNVMSTPNTDVNYNQIQVPILEDYVQPQFPNPPTSDNISNIYDTTYICSDGTYYNKPVPIRSNSKSGKKSKSLLGDSINDDVCYVQIENSFFPITGYPNENWFSDLYARHIFIRKVFMILTLQLFVTFGIVALFSFVDPVRNFMLENIWMVWPALAGSIVFLLIFACCDMLVKTKPWNYIIMGAFTIIEAYLAGIIAACYSRESVLSAMLITFVVTTCLVLFACQTKYDFTGIGPYLMAFLLILIGVGILNAILCASKECQFLSTVYAAGGAILFSFYIIYDTQLIVGGRHRKYEFSENDHVFAALALYLDIINFFMYILQLCGNKRD